MKHKNCGFSLLELMLVLVVIVGGATAAYKIFKPSQTQAAVRQEQENVGRMVDKIMGAYSTASNFSTLSTTTAAGILNAPVGANGLNSAMKTDVTIRPATTLSANDSFDVVYASLSPDKCIALIPALTSHSNAVFIGQRTQNLQNARGAITDESLIATQCASSSSTSVTFRFRADKNTFASTTTDSCLCAPETETQTLACPSGSGSITQRRTATCTGGTPVCPSAQWSSWTTASNTCAADGNPIAPIAPVAPVAPNTCVPSVEIQTVACPAGQVGGVLQQRTRVCPANTWGAWNTISSSCQTDPNRPACTPSTQRQTTACPAGQGGQIVQERASICDTNGNQVWSNDWKNISSTCTASCVTAGTCCTVSRQASTELQYCGVGNYGSIQRDVYRTSTCPTATSTPVWGDAWNESRRNGTCTACPTPVQDQETQAVPASTACPSGQTGSRTWTSNQVRTRTRSYVCPDRTLTIPAPTVGAWSAWSEFSRTGETNTCASAPTNVCFVAVGEVESGTSDTRDAYWSVNYTVQGEASRCFSTYRDDKNSGVCDEKVLSLEAWARVARDGEMYTTSGSQSGWESSGGEFWSWTTQSFERRSGAACGPAPTTCTWVQTSGSFTSAGGNGAHTWTNRYYDGGGNTYTYQMGLNGRGSGNGEINWGVNPSPSYAKPGATYRYESRNNPEGQGEWQAQCGTSSGNYDFVDQSCAAETHYALGSLDQQARALCTGRPAGEQIGNIHHFPSNQIGCYATVKCI